MKRLPGVFALSISKPSINLQQSQMFDWLIRIVPFLLPVILMLVPHFAWADAISPDSTSLNFKPPAGDVSVIFLGNVFGVVDGVLAGTGSQIAGQMFGVFNTAVLSLGGILIAYTLMVSTLNTAQEGQFLGQRFSSVWVPVRSISGVLLLMPKASGYCMIQVFVMWVVVQGVGAADKIWASALNYLNRGGAIVRPNVDPVSQMATAGKGGADILNGAYGMLTGQVCMVGMNSMINQFQDYLRTDTIAKKLCDDSANASSGDPTYLVHQWCTTSIPNMTDTVNFSSDTVLKAPSNSLVTVSMPNYPDDSPYKVLNGACGSVQFKQFDTSDLVDNQEAMGLTTSDIETISQSRAIAMEQMYQALLPTAQKIVENNAKKLAGDTATPLGVPVTLSLGKCTGYINAYQSGCALDDAGCMASTYWDNSQIYDTSTWEQNAYQDKGYLPDACLSWNAVNGATAGVLLRGSEIQDAVSAYNGMMSSSLFVASSADQATSYGEQREFIKQAEQTGWLMAGAYYFRLAILNSQVLQDTSSGNSVDTKSGLQICGPPSADKTVSCPPWDTQNLTSFYVRCTQWKDEPSQKNLLCADGNSHISSGIKTLLKPLVALIDGGGTSQIPQAVVNTPAQPVYQDVAGGMGSSRSNINAKYEYPDSVYGYLINSTALVMPGQPGSETPDITFKLTFNASTNVPQLESESFSGGKFGIPGQVITKIFGAIIQYFFNWLLSFIVPLVNMLVFAFLQPPLALLASVFSGAMEVLKNPDVNPILALANMGIGFIEGCANSWVLMIAAGVSAAVLGPVAFGFLMVLMPVVGVWIGVMFSVGATAAYYLPLTPFLVFLFASMGWFIGVIEAMVAAPLVALGIMNPEGSDAFGKSDQAVMLLLGAFLRPAMMIMGYIFGIILSYVGIWFVNAGMSIVIPQVENMPLITTDEMYGSSDISSSIASGMQSAGQFFTGNSTAYGAWSTIFLYFFMLLIYISTLLAVVNKSFELIHYLPDKVLRWIGGGGESLGEMSQRAGQDVKRAHDKGAKASEKATGQMATGMTEQLTPGGGKGGGKGDKDKGKQQKSGAKKGDFDKAKSDQKSSTTDSDSSSDQDSSTTTDEDSVTTATGNTNTGTSPDVDVDVIEDL